MPSDKVCFVIGPFGDPNSKIRKWSDFLFQQIIRPVTEEERFTSHRTIDSPEPGRITDRVLRELHEADLVIGDLTDASPNAFYELGARHATKKPFIHVAKSGTPLPFDVLNYSCVMVDAYYVEQADTYLISDTDKEAAQRSLRMQIRQPALPENKSGYAHLTFSWSTHYSPTIATDWLDAQTTGVREAIRRYEEQLENETPTERIRQALAEYLVLKSAASQVYNGVVFVVVDRATRMFEKAGAVYEFVESAPSYIPISGRVEDQTWVMTFDQPSREVRVGVLNERLPSYNYTVEFKRQGQDLTGDIIHPLSHTLVGHATFTPSYGSRLDV